MEHTTFIKIKNKNLKGIPGRSNCSQTFLNITDQTLINFPENGEYYNYLTQMVDNIPSAKYFIPLY